MNTPTTKKQTRFDHFESTTCPKCGGEGRVIQHSNVLNGVCFKCNGEKLVLTTRGKADYDAYRAAVDAATIRPLSEVKTGMFCKLEGMSKYYPVASVSEPFVSGGYYPAPGADLIPSEYVTVTFARMVAKSNGMWTDRADNFQVPVLNVTTALSDGTFPAMTVRIHAGESMPKPEDFDSRRKAA